MFATLPHVCAVQHILELTCLKSSNRKHCSRKGIQCKIPWDAWLGLLLFGGVIAVWVLFVLCVVWTSRHPLKLKWPVILWSHQAPSAHVDHGLVAVDHAAPTNATRPLTKSAAWLNSSMHICRKRWSERGRSISYFLQSISSAWSCSICRSSCVWSSCSSWKNKLFRHSLITGCR